MLPNESSAATVKLTELPVITVVGEPTMPKRVVGPGLIRIALLVPVRVPVSVAKMVRLPAVFNVALKTPSPPVNGALTGNVGLPGSVEVKLSTPE